MSLEPESIGHKAAAMSEDDSHPAWEQEADAKRSIADALEPRVEFLSRRSVEQIAGWVLANAPYLRSVLASLESGERKQLKQQRSAELSDVDHWLEVAAQAKDDWRHACEMARQAGAHPADYEGPQDRMEQEDTDRLNAERAADKAVEGFRSVAS